MTMNANSNTYNADSDAYRDEVYLSITFMSIPRDRAVALVEAALEVSKTMSKPAVSFSFDKAMVDE